MIGQMLADPALAAQAIKEINDINYPRFGDIMTKMGYDWEPMKVTTDDGYILTTFHILGKTGEARKNNKGAVLVQHGDQEDGTSWIQNYTDKDEMPFHLKLVDEGYDIWIGSNRGTQYSWDHV